MTSSGLESVYLDNRAKLVRFLIARGAGDAAEDLVNDLWLKLMAQSGGPIANPLAYLYRAADTLMIDRYRSRRRMEQRDRDWTDAAIGDGVTSETPSGERVVIARQEIAQVAEVLAALGPRREAVFRRARIEGVPRKQIAAELGVSLSTVETDLSIACRALAEMREQLG